MLFGERLRTLRDKAGLSQKDLTEKLNINRSTYARYETSSTQPDFETLTNLADFFGVTTDYLLGHQINKVTNLQFEKEERDIAKRLKDFERELQECDGLAFNGEPMSDEARESLLESMELLFRQTQRINKKFAPKKYRDEE